MTLLMNQMQVESSEATDKAEENFVSQSYSDELTILMKSVHEQHNPMPDKLKAEKQASAPSLEQLFEQTVKNKGESSKLKTSWISDTEVEVEGISQMTLHCFLLKAEALGKKVTYTRTLKVQVTD